MDAPEYLGLFKFQDGGDMCIKVKFKDHDGGVADLSMHAGEIVKLIDPLTRQFYTEMRFDDWLFEIYKYQIDPINNQLIIMVRKSKDGIYN